VPVGGGCWERRQEMKPGAQALPISDSKPGRSVERPDRAEERERRMTRLFRRWPALSEREHRELRSLWRARIERAQARSARLRRADVSGRRFPRRLPG